MLNHNTKECETESTPKFAGDTHDDTDINVERYFP
jgi:hypothetical protein